MYTVKKKKNSTHVKRGFTELVALLEKSDKEDLDNYRPISLLSILYKVFTPCLLARIRRTLEEAQPVEQAGFRRSFSTIDHIATCTRIIEACREHQMPLIMTFIDYCKALDSVEHHTVWESLLEQGVERKYVDVLKDCYPNRTTKFRPFNRPIVGPIKKGVRQGDPISPNLFSAVLESVIRKCDWDDFGVNINRRMLNHLRFADIVLLTHTPQEAERMVRQLEEVGKKVGLRLNAKKTKVMRNRFADPSAVRLGQTTHEVTDNYVYLGRLINMTDDLKPEIIRRKGGAWSAHNTIKPAVSEIKNQKLRAELFNSRHPGSVLRKRDVDMKEV
ncbi:reverse transcriptase [Ancylostoma ceylanicum]|uniref:Reverse transcriptase n=1 Tax=Ancylostoma ceylanicum TaxID=53326 RepID=A0A0D6LJZ4_9BILA|nr:reverse transcriptase [Ancylostoma ceylanicum]